jgi:V/A-type H+/Na+-transporting ATPase subunit K
MDRKLRLIGSIVVVLAVFTLGTAFCAESQPGQPRATNNVVAIAMAVSVAAGMIGAGYAVAKVGSAAIGAVSERPELATRALLYVALAEGIAVWGIVGAALLINAL